MMIMEKTTLDRFREFIKKEILTEKEACGLEGWPLYEYLKSFIEAWDIDYEAGIKIITEEAEV